MHSEEKSQKMYNLRTNGTDELDHIKIQYDAEFMNAPEDTDYRSFNFEVVPLWLEKELSSLKSSVEHQPTNISVSSTEPPKIANGNNSISKLITKHNKVIKTKQDSEDLLSNSIKE